MDKQFEIIVNIMEGVLPNREAALEFVINELSFANKSSLVVRNFAKASGIHLKVNPPVLELNSPNIVFSNLLASRGSFQSSIELRMNIIDEIMKINQLGKYSNINDREIIKAFCLERGIEELIHFTRIKNIRSILDIGLNSKDYNQEISKAHKINDMNRFDYRTHMISLSISYPNDKMFYKYRVADTEQKWAVLKLSPSILWELGCLFCPVNAASAVISSATDQLLSGSKALEKLFLNQPENLRPCDPSDSQAEVLVNSHIPKKYIESIVVESANVICSDIYSSVIEDTSYFHNRNYALNNHF